jgi:uncharacterized protein (UPF0210 family)
MSLTKQVVIDKIEVVENGTIQVRQVTRIIEDGTEISKQYHRTSLTPGQDLTDQPANVVAVCNAVWTPQVIAAYQAQAAQTPQGV